MGAALGPTAAPPRAAHGAVVEPPVGGGSGVEEAHGALVGWLGPLGTGAAWAIPREEAQGAAVPTVGGIAPPTR